MCRFKPSTRNESSQGKVVVMRECFGPSMSYTPSVMESYITAKVTTVAVFFVTYGAIPKKLLSFEDVINIMRSVNSSSYHLRPKKRLSRRKHLSM